MLGQIAWREVTPDGRETLRCSPAAVAYIKLVPLSEAEAAALLADRERSDTRRLYAHNDVEFPRLRTPEEIRRHIEPFRDSDFSRMYWESAMGDLAYYFSKIGRVGTHDGLDDFFHAEARSSAENWRRFEERGIDPFEIAIEHTHDIGLEFHACYRVSGFHTPLSHDHWDHGGFVYDNHPEWRGMDRYGNPTPHVAYHLPRGAPVGRIAAQGDG